MALIHDFTGMVASGEPSEFVIAGGRRADDAARVEGLPFRNSYVGGPPDPHRALRRGHPRRAALGRPHHRPAGAGSRAHRPLSAEHLRALRHGPCTRARPSLPIACLSRSSSPTRWAPRSRTARRAPRGLSGGRADWVTGSRRATAWRATPPRRRRADQTRTRSASKPRVAIASARTVAPPMITSARSGSMPGHATRRSKGSGPARRSGARACDQLQRSMMDKVPVVTRDAPGRGERARRLCPRGRPGAAATAESAAP